MYTSARFEQRELDLHKQIMKMCPAETPDVPRIELDRAANIARNRLLLEALGIPQLVAKGIALQRLKSVAQRKSSRVKGLAPTRVSCRAVARKYDSLSEGNLSETLTSHLKLPSFKLARITRERMPARTALPDINWAADQTFCNKHDEEKGCTWCRSFEKEPEFDGRLDVAREIAHRLGSQGISFETVAGADSALDFLDIAYANKGPPSAGIDFAMKRVLKGVKAGEKYNLLIVLALWLAIWLIDANPNDKCFC
jgi:hypothetical protein